MTSIEWVRGADGAQGKTWNPVAGCSIVSPGCSSCYAMRMAARLEAMARSQNATRTDPHHGGKTFDSPLAHYVGTTQPTKVGPVWTDKVALAPEHVLTAPLRRRKPTTWFVNSMSDLFHEDVPFDWIMQVLVVMALSPAHTFQVLTKRSDKMRDVMASGEMGGAVNAAARVNAIRLGRQVPDAICWPLKNLWLGVSAERQQEADERIPDLLATPAAVRFVSAEPLLGPVEMKRWLPTGRRVTYLDKTQGIEPRFYMTMCEHCGWTGSSELCGGGDDDIVCPSCCRSMLGDELPSLDWIIVGGESGPGARPMHPHWARSIRDQCQAAGVPFFFKQWGEWAHEGQINPATGRQWLWPCEAEGEQRVGKKAAGRLLDGREWNEMPHAKAEESV